MFVFRDLRLVQPPSPREKAIRIFKVNTCFYCRQLVQGADRLIIVHIQEITTIPCFSIGYFLTQNIISSYKNH